MGPGQDSNGKLTYRVAVVDDEATNRALFKAALSAGPYDCRYFASGTEFLAAMEQGAAFDIVLLDVMMPDMDGFQVCGRLRSQPETRYLPVIMVTGLDDTMYKIKGLEIGADDYLSKPFHPLELKARMSALLRVADLTDELKHKNLLLSDEKVHLERLVQERTKELEDVTLGIVAALEKANEMNDMDTGLHILRVSVYSTILAEAIGLPPELTAKIRRYASLHDVGKVAVPDELLKKPGKLTMGEFEEMKKHTVYGYELLRLAKGDMIAQNIAWAHHERHNGTGYPRGLKGEEIPIEARVVALADVFDALTTKRVYKQSYDLESSRGIIREECSSHFDPSVVAAFEANWESFVQVFTTYGDAQGQEG